MRVLSIDYGDVRIGFARSDILKITANPIETYTRVDIDKDIEHIKDLINEHNISEIVIGLPFNLDGTFGPRAQKTKEFVSILKDNISLPMFYQDERLSSKQAEDMLIENGVHREKRKGLVDKVAATIILQDFLNSYKKLPVEEV